jgi:hypothetical protein
MGIGTALHIRNAERPSGCARFGVSEIRVALTNVSDAFRRAGASRRYRIVFSGDVNERAIEQKKQAEVPSDADLQWRRTLRARTAAPHQPVLLAPARAGPPRREDTSRDGSRRARSPLCTL